MYIELILWFPHRYQISSIIVSFHFKHDSNLGTHHGVHG